MTDRQTARRPFGDALRAAYEAKGLTRADLARTIGVAYNTLWRYEKGENLPGAKVWARILEAVGQDAREAVAHLPKKDRDKLSRISGPVSEGDVRGARAARGKAGRRGIARLYSRLSEEKLLDPRGAAAWSAYCLFVDDVQWELGSGTFDVTTYEELARTTIKLPTVVSALNALEAIEAHAEAPGPATSDAVKARCMDLLEDAIFLVRLLRGEHRTTEGRHDEDPDSE